MEPTLTHASLGLFQVGDGGPADHEGSAAIDGHHGVEEIDLSILEKHAGGAGGIVDHPIQSAKFIDGLCDHLGWIVSFFQAADDSMGIGAEGIDHLLHGVRPAAVHCHFGALCDT